MSTFDADFAVDVFQVLLLQFSAEERKHIVETPNIVRQPNYSRRLRFAFDDLIRGVPANYTELARGVTPYGKLEANHAPVLRLVR